jgi:hypothetical protein
MMAIEVELIPKIVSISPTRIMAKLGVPVGGRVMTGYSVASYTPWWLSLVAVICYTVTHWTRASSGTIEPLL